MSGTVIDHVYACVRITTYFHSIVYLKLPKATNPINVVLCSAVCLHDYYYYASISNFTARFVEGTSGIPVTNENSWLEMESRNTHVTSGTSLNDGMCNVLFWIL